MWCIHQNFSLLPESTGVPLREPDAAQQAADGRGRAETGSQCRAGLRGSDPLAGSWNCRTEDTAGGEESKTCLWNRGNASPQPGKKHTTLLTLLLWVPLLLFLREKMNVAHKSFVVWPQGQHGLWVCVIICVISTVHFKRIAVFYL